MIKTKIISEIVGSPEEHVNNTLSLLLDKIKDAAEPPWCYFILPDNRYQIINAIPHINLFPCNSE